MLELIMVLSAEFGKHSDLVVVAALLVVNAGVELYEGAPRVLCNETKQNHRGGRHRGCSRGHRPHTRWSSRPPAIVMVANTRELWSRVSSSTMP